MLLPWKQAERCYRNILWVIDYLSLNPSWFQIFKLWTKKYLKFWPHWSISVKRCETKNFYLYSFLIFSWEENLVENWKCQALKISKFRIISAKNMKVPHLFTSLTYWETFLPTVVSKVNQNMTYKALNSLLCLFLCLPYNSRKNLENKLFIKQCKLHPAKKWPLITKLSSCAK